jgi:hypothetical protein
VTCPKLQTEAESLDNFTYTKTTTNLALYKSEDFKIFSKDEARTGDINVSLKSV